jgi:hypothetical protein
VRDRRLAEPHSDSVQILEVRIRKVGITLGQIVDGLVHPVALVILPSLKNSTPVDVAEELIASSAHYGFLGQTHLHLSLLGADRARSRYVWLNSNP